VAPGTTAIRDRRRAVITSAGTTCHPPGYLKRRRNRHIAREILMTLGTILIVILVLMLIGAIPSWPHSRAWGYGPSGVLGTVLVVILILVLIGRI
jgi:Na+/melibiose symporter-like transporter